MGPDSLLMRVGSSREASVNAAFCDWEGDKDREENREDNFGGKERETEDDDGSSKIY